MNNNDLISIVNEHSNKLYNFNIKKEKTFMFIFDDNTYEIFLLFLLEKYQSRRLDHFMELPMEI